MNENATSGVNANELQIHLLFNEEEVAERAKRLSDIIRNNPNANPLTLEARETTYLANLARYFLDHLGKSNEDMLLLALKEAEFGHSGPTPNISALVAKFRAFKQQVLDDLATSDPDTYAQFGEDLNERYDPNLEIDPKASKEQDPEKRLSQFNLRITDEIDGIVTNALRRRAAQNDQDISATRVDE